MTDYDYFDMPKKVVQMYVHRAGIRDDYVASTW